MTANRRIGAGLIMLTLATVLLVVGGVDGPLRGLVSLSFMLVAPGLAISLLMGPMSIQARVLVSIAGSAATVTIVSVVLAAAGVWSTSFGLALPATFVTVTAIHVLRVPPTADTPTADIPTARAPDEHRSDLPAETARRIR